MKITKQDLKNLSSDKMKVQDLKQQIEDLREAAAIVQYRYSIAPGSKSSYSDVLADKVDKLIEYQNELSEMQLQYAERNRDILNRIKQLPTPYYAVIYKRYVDLLSWKRIAIILNYSESAVRKIHDRAIILLQQGAAEGGAATPPQEFQGTSYN